MIELNEQGKGIIEVAQIIPPELKSFHIDTASPVLFTGVGFRSLIQEFKGEGFSAWYNLFWTKAPVIVTARADMPVLELRIGLKNIIRGTWDKISNPELEPYSFQMGYVPHVATRAVFDAALEYQTFDIHFEFSFLSRLGVDYKTLDRFLNSVDKKEPAELSFARHRCSPIMIDAIRHILSNNYSAAGKARVLRNHIENILIAALEIVGREEIKELPLSVSDIEALHHVRKLIELNCPEYLSNDVLVKKTNLNAFKLSYGFKRVFGINPYDYYLQLRFEEAKRLLKDNNSVTAVALMLEYESPTTFIKAFRKRFGYTPKQWQKGMG